MRAPDTSVLVAALASWHEQHRPAASAIPGCALIGHTAVELVSVLTRLPEPHRIEGSIVATFLDDTFDGSPLVLPAVEMRTLPRHLIDLGVTGGATYYGLIAATARHFGATLITLDERAVRTYERLGVDHTAP